MRSGLAGLNLAGLVLGSTCEKWVSRVNLAGFILGATFEKWVSRVELG